jgi:hypothetical protein
MPGFHVRVRDAQCPFASRDECGRLFCDSFAGERALRLSDPANTFSACTGRSVCSEAAGLPLLRDGNRTENSFAAQQFN